MATFLKGMVAISVPLFQTAHAASISISPVSVEIKAPARAGSITLSNQGQEEVRLQARVIKWRQENGTTILEPTRDVIVSPASITLPVGQSYTLRVARLGGVRVDQEEAFRVILDELPVPQSDRGPNTSVRLNLRTSLPVFFVPLKATPVVDWSLIRGAQGLEIRASNRGTKTFKIVGLTLAEGESSIPFSSAGAEAYVLPGSTMAYRPSRPLSKTYPPGTTFTLTTNPSTPFAVNQQITLTGD